MATLDEETAKKVIRQVEFYFSDSNLPRDKFLTEKTNESDDGLVSVALISSFTRMRNHLGLGDVKPEDVSEDTVKAVVECLRTSTFLKVSEDGKKVGRANALPLVEEAIKLADERTIAASPLEYDVKIEDVESFFGQHAEVCCVRLPCHVADKRLFCGTALIEFSSEDTAQQILKETLTYSGVELELKPKKDFDTERAKQEEDVARTRPQEGSKYKEKKAANAEPDYPEGLIIAFKLRSISTKDTNKQNGNNESVCSDTNVSTKDGEENKETKSEETEQKVTEEAAEMNPVEDAGNGKEEKEADTTGTETEAKESEDTEKSPAILDEKENLGSTQQKPTLAAYKDDKNVILREDLKSIFGKFGTVKFVDFKMGSESGYIRFEVAEAAQKARAAAALAEEGGLVVKNFIASLDPVTGEAEKEYWSLLRNNQDNRRDNFKSNRGRGGRHNRGGRNFGGKHSRSRDNDNGGRQNKVRKV